MLLWETLFIGLSVGTQTTAGWVLLLTPHSYSLTPHSYSLTPYSYSLTPYSYSLSPYSSAKAACR